MKKVLSIVLVVAMLATLLVGCGTTQTATTETKTEEKKTEPTKAQETTKSDIADTNYHVDIEVKGGDEITTDGAGIKMALCLTSTLGDKALADTTWLGLNKLKEDYPGIEIKVYEAPNGSTDWEPNMIAASEWADIIFVTASSCGDVLEQKIVPNYPDKTYVAIERCMKGYDNVASCVFACNESGFLQGVVAGLFIQDTNIPRITGSKTVGYIGGMQAPTLLDYVGGWEYGVKYVCPDATCLQAWTGTYTDPLLNKDQTKALIAQGADVVFGNLGASVNAMFEAADEEKIYTFGNDTDKDALYPGTMITSGLKCGDAVTYKYGKEFIEGLWEPGFMMMTTKEGAIDLTEFAVLKGELGDKFPQYIVDEVNKIKQDLIDGKIEVPYVPATRGEE